MNFVNKFVSTVLFFCVISITYQTKLPSWTIKCTTGKLEESVSVKPHKSIPIEMGEIYDITQYLQSHYEDNIKVFIENCPLPQTSYVDFLSRNKFNVTSIETLILTNMESSSRSHLQQKHLAGLSIKSLALNCRNGLKNASVENTFLNSLRNLTKLTVFGVKMPPISPHTKLVEAEFGRGQSLAVFGSCTELKSLSQWQIQVENFLASCHQLNHLQMSSMLAQTVAEVIHDTTHLRNLSISKCELQTLIGISFSHMKDLVQLELEQNSLKGFKFITYLPSLKVLNLNQNTISVEYEEIVKLFENLPQLKSLELSFNPRFDLCKNKDTTSNHIKIFHPQLENLVLSHTSTTLSCLGIGSFPSLKYLDLRSTNIQMVQELQLSTLPLHVNLWSNEITDINFTETDYEKFIAKRDFVKKSTVLLDGYMGLDCDCHNRWFAAALKENLVLAPNALCTDSNINITLIPPRQLNCYKFSCDGCTCRHFFENNFTESICSANTGITKVPKVPGLSKLLAPFNRIVLSKNDIPDTLTHLDLRKNDITCVDEEATKVLFSVSTRQILFSDNPFQCGCKNYAFIQIFQNHITQIKDSENVTCAGNGKVLRDVILSELCHEDINGKLQLQAALIAGGAVLAVAVLTVMFYCRFGTTVHMFLYARGWICCVNEEKLDADRQYDAFVSFCYKDVSVACEIMSWLEERGFKLCVHTRDWMPGEMIPTQIVRSVETSRRTIILLSQHYAESMWGLLEFRIAHVRALSEGVMRVILIVLDDVLESANLNEDIRRYIRLNTYVRYDDPWFLDKLFYAMPRRRTQSMPVFVPVGKLVSESHAGALKPPKEVTEVNGTFQPLPATLAASSDSSQSP